MIGVMERRSVKRPDFRGQKVEPTKIGAPSKGAQVVRLSKMRSLIRRYSRRLDWEIPELGGEGRIRTYGLVAQTAAVGTAASNWPTLAPLHILNILIVSNGTEATLSCGL